MKNPKTLKKTQVGLVFPEKPRFFPTLRLRYQMSGYLSGFWIWYPARHWIWCPSGYWIWYNIPDIRLCITLPVINDYNIGSLLPSIELYNKLMELLANTLSSLWTACQTGYQNCISLRVIKNVEIQNRIHEYRIHTTFMSPFVQFNKDKLAKVAEYKWGDKKAIPIHPFPLLIIILMYKYRKKLQPSFNKKLSIPGYSWWDVPPLWRPWFKSWLSSSSSSRWFLPYRNIWLNHWW